MIAVCRTYVAAQNATLDGHDGSLPASTRRFAERSAHKGLCWQAARGERLSPLGELVAQAAEEGRPLDTGSGQPSSFHGYRYKILTAQEAAASGGAKNLVIKGEMSGGFALVAWPADYDITGVMTFIVNQDGTLHEKDLGPDTPALAQAMTASTDSSWRVVPVQTP